MDSRPHAHYLKRWLKLGAFAMRRLWMSLPKLIRFMLVHIANGMVIGCIFLLVLIRFDVAGLARLLESDTSGLATFILFFQTALTFGAVSMGVAVMHLGED
jgi:hypothetical protein